MNRRILALSGILMLLCLLLAIPALADAQPDTIRAGQIISEVNLERTRRGLSPLSEDADLTQAACQRAMELTRLFSHTRPDGTSCFTVSEKAYGENIARGHNSVSRVMAAWMSSDGHQRNILRASYGSIGVCCIEIDGIWYWVQLFGK